MTVNDFIESLTDDAILCLIRGSIEVRGYNSVNCSTQDFKRNLGKFLLDHLTEQRILDLTEYLPEGFLRGLFRSSTNYLINNTTDNYIRDLFKQCIDHFTHRLPNIFISDFNRLPAKILKELTKERIKALTENLPQDLVKDLLRNATTDYIKLLNPERVMDFSQKLNFNSNEHFSLDFINEFIRNIIVRFIQQQIDDYLQDFIDRLFKNKKYWLTNDSKFKSLKPATAKKYSLHAIEGIKIRIYDSNPNSNLPCKLFTPFYHRGMEFFLEEIFDSVLDGFINLLTYAIDFAHSFFSISKYFYVSVSYLFADYNLAKHQMHNFIDAIVNCANILVSVILHIAYIPIEFALRLMATIIPLQKIFGYAIHETGIDSPINEDSSVNSVYDKNDRNRDDEVQYRFFDNANIDISKKTDPIDENFSDSEGYYTPPTSPR